jgi:rRNA maturation RNase YbeY
MIKVYVSKQANYPVSTTKVKKRLSEFFKKQGITSDADVSISLVGEKEMVGLASKYLKEEDKVHNVLSFPFMEGEEFKYPSDDVVHLGDIVVCYPKAISEANFEGKLIEVKILELIEHGAMHLMGKHHE